MTASYKMNCTCKHDYQDTQYGKGIRLATPCKGSNSPDRQTIRCTVCLKQIEVKK